MNNICFKSIKDLTDDIKKFLLPNIPTDISTVVGIPRSGMIPASIIATAIGAKLKVLGQEGDPLSGWRMDNYLNKKEDGRVLLVDDSCGSGKSMQEAKRRYGTPCLTCAIYPKSHSKHIVDLFATVFDGTRFFEWNFNGSGITKKSYYDMDGVICEDPTTYDDDGTTYGNAIATAKPLYLPQVEIEAICTNRIERWRAITEEWLKRHGVKYKKLIMQPYPTAVERRRHGNPGIYKARHYAETERDKVWLFVESHDVQAKVIYEKSGRPCLSIESMTLFGGKHE
jgi:uncharacterized HAD superfamily protein